MATGHLLLGLLHRGQRHGYDLKQAHDAQFPHARPMAYGQVYAALDRLLRQGLVEPREVQRAEGPDRTVYAVTTAGREELAVWLAAPEVPPARQSNPFADKVTVALLLGEQGVAERYLRAQRGAHLARMRDHTKAKSEPGAPLTAVLAADFALAHLDADLRWMDAALERVSALEKEMGEAS